MKEFIYFAVKSIIIVLVAVVAYYLYMWLLQK